MATKIVKCPKCGGSATHHNIGGVQCCHCGHGCGKLFENSEVPATIPPGKTLLTLNLMRCAMTAKVYKHSFEGTGQSVFVLAKNLEDASETAQKFLDNLPDAEKYEYVSKLPMPINKFRFEVPYNCF